MSFPADWPADCPPAQCVDARCEIVRVVKTIPPTSADFLSYAEMLKEVRAGKECESKGLSVFGKIDDARHYADLYPHVGDKFCIGTLEPHHGKTLATPRHRNSHVTWWPYDGVNRPSLFRAVT